MLPILIHAVLVADWEGDLPTPLILSLVECSAEDACFLPRWTCFVLFRMNSLDITNNVRTESVQNPKPCALDKRLPHPQTMHRDQLRMRLLL